MRAPFFGLHCWKLTQDSGMPYNEKNKSFAARLCLSYSEVPYTNKIVFIAAIFIFGILAVGNTVVKISGGWFMLPHIFSWPFILVLEFWLLWEKAVCRSAPRNICFAVDAVSDGASAVEIPKLLNMLGKILG